ncbi:segregation and condensation protein A [Spiribacter halobius]|uniref:Segregation and condensation protein A n=1 Tax=Sediminicurvatus halobius TaxID=2182432 RepID=A0A2U2N328_9GAMM|nr:ScpA family protein [Spiribacter halobius]PWG63492.1 segregation/condensation protein A [Spiribacter halobius]UEX79637.1 segregation/condensation protein A [Spiribacter halobius]
MQEAAAGSDDAAPIARVRGEPLADLPRDLYIPPDALEVFLETFEGPLDLLLYLIRRQNLDILDIPIAEITRQYMAYVELMKDVRLELAAEYLVMAAVLAEIKSRMLLPRPPAADQDEEHDPRAELVRRLQEYERYKEAAAELDNLPRVARDIFPAKALAPEMTTARQEPEVALRELLAAFAEVLDRAEMFTHHQVQREALSVRQRMAETLEALSGERFTGLGDLLRPEEGRAGVVVTFLAILELLKASLVELVQAEPFAPLYLRAAGSRSEAPPVPADGEGA